MKRIYLVTVNCVIRLMRQGILAKSRVSWVGDSHWVTAPFLLGWTFPRKIDYETTVYESKWFERGVKEELYIGAYIPTLNGVGGRYNLPSTWNTSRFKHRNLNALAPGPRSHL